LRTDWNRVAKWYGDYLKQDDTYQRTVVFPGVIKLLHPRAGNNYLDIACGEGSFANELARSSGARVTGIDAAPRLIAQAKRLHRPDLHFMIGDAQRLDQLVKPNSFDGAICILALQNIADYAAVIQAAATTLRPGSLFVLVINHPCFRAPRQSGWGFDDVRKLQYRRVDSYLSPNQVPIQVHPGNALGVTTWSFHRPLTDYVSTLATAGFVITGLEEWISHRHSKPGPRAKAENRARLEIPLFLAVRAKLN
jgi:SAM-dependent methyltransferase